MINYCYVTVCSAALGASAPTEGGEGRGHIVAAVRLQLVKTWLLVVLSLFNKCFNLLVYANDLLLLAPSWCAICSF